MSVPPSARTALLGLRGVRLLEGLDTPALEALSGVLDWRRFNAGQQVIARNAPDRDVYLVIAGKVQVVAFSASGKQITYREMGAGDHFGELAAIARVHFPHIRVQTGGGEAVNQPGNVARPESNRGEAAPTVRGFEVVRAGASGNRLAVGNPQEFDVGEVRGARADEGRAVGGAHALMFGERREREAQTLVDGSGGGKVGHGDDEVVDSVEHRWIVAARA
jgi:hypothetical protein